MSSQKPELALKIKASKAQQGWLPSFYYSLHLPTHSLSFTQTVLLSTQGFRRHFWINDWKKEGREYRGMKDRKKKGREGGN
jgi:hypothetical protein